MEVTEKKTTYKNNKKSSQFMRTFVRIKPQFKGKDFDNWINKVL